MVVVALLEGGVVLERVHRQQGLMALIWVRHSAAVVVVVVVAVVVVPQLSLDRGQTLDHLVVVVVVAQ